MVARLPITGGIKVLGLGTYSEKHVKRDTVDVGPFIL